MQRDLKRKGVPAPLVKLFQERFAEFAAEAEGDEEGDADEPSDGGRVVDDRAAVGAGPWDGHGGGMQETKQQAAGEWGGSSRGREREMEQMHTGLSVGGSGAQRGGRGTGDLVVEGSTDVGMGEGGSYEDEEEDGMHSDMEGEGEEEDDGALVLLHKHRSWRPGVRGFAQAKAAPPPRRMPSESETEKEFDKMIQDLADCQRAGWKARLAHLERIRSLLAGGAGRSSAAFVRGVMRLRDCWCEQVADRRSAISKVASLTLAEVSAVLQQRMEPIADVLVRALLKIVVITTAVISSSGDLCLRALLHNTRKGFHKVLPLLASASKSKSAVLRAKASDYLLSTLRGWSGEVLHRHQDQLIDAVKHLLSDANQAARSNARVALWSLRELFPEDCARLEASLDAGTARRALSSKQEREAYDARAGAIAEFEAVVGVGPDADRDLVKGLPGGRRDRGRHGRGGRGALPHSKTMTAREMSDSVRGGAGSGAGTGAGAASGGAAGTAGSRASRADAARAQAGVGAGPRRGLQRGSKSFWGAGSPGASGAGSRTLGTGAAVELEPEVQAAAGAVQEDRHRQEPSPLTRRGHGSQTGSRAGSSRASPIALLAGTAGAKRDSPVDMGMGEQGVPEAAPARGSKGKKTSLADLVLAEVGGKKEATAEHGSASGSGASSGAGAAAAVSEPEAAQPPEVPRQQRGQHGASTEARVDSGLSGSRRAGAGSDAPTGLLSSEDIGGVAGVLRLLRGSDWREQRRAAQHVTQAFEASAAAQEEQSRPKSAGRLSTSSAASAHGRLVGDASEMQRRCSPLLRALCACASASHNEKVAVDVLTAVAATVRHASSRLGPEDVRSVYATSLPSAASRSAPLRAAAEDALGAMRSALPPGMQLAALSRAVGGASARGATKNLGPALAQLCALLQGTDGAAALQHAPGAAKALTRRLAKVILRGASAVTGARDAVAAGLGEGMGSSATPGQAAAAAAAALSVMADTEAALPLVASALGSMIEAEVRSMLESVD